MNLMLIVLLLVIGKASCEITSFHTKYSLRCDNPKEGNDQKFCNIIEQDEQQDKLQALKRDGNNNGLLKRLFDKIMPSTLSYKANDVSCVTEDCDIQTLKIKRMDRKNRHGPNNFACVGNPYTDSGSKCYPIEGLYIG